MRILGIVPGVVREGEALCARECSGVQRRAREDKPDTSTTELDPATPKSGAMPAIRRP